MDNKNKIRILVAEDSLTQAEVLKYILEKHDYEVTIAKDGREALTFIQEQKPALVISDIIMPEMNGYKLCKAIKSEKSTSDIPVILLTALSRSEDVLDGLECGADNFITKPYSEDYLIAMIEHILENKDIIKKGSDYVSVEIIIRGKKRMITASQQQMLTLLLSTYEAAAHRNQELVRTQDELNKINEHLEELVMERTAELSEEIEIRKNVEKTLRESEDIFNLFMEHSPVHVFFKDENIRSIKLSKNYERMLGKPMNELLGKRMDEIFPSELAKSMVEDDLKILKEGKVTVIEEELNGRFYTSIKFPIYIQGRPPYLAGYSIDTTERKKAEEAIQESNDKFRTIFENNSAAIALIHPDTTIIMVNDEYCKISGYTKEEVIGMSWTKQIPPDDLERLKEYNRRRMINPDDAPNKYEFKFYKKDGEIRHAYMSVAMLSNHTILTSFIDITDLNQALEELRASENKFRSYIENAPNFIFVVDDKGRYIEVNKSATELFGYTEKEFENKYIHDLIAKESVEEGLSHFKKLVETGRANSDLWHINKDGSKRLLTVNAVKLSETRALGFANDITERKKVENALRIKNFVFDASITANSISDINGILTEANNSFLSVWGYTDKQEVLGRPISDFFENPDEAIKIIVNLNNFGAWEGDYIAKKKDGSTFFAYGHATVVKNEEGENIGYQSSVLDISKRKQAEDTLKENNVLLKTLINTIPAPVFHKDSNGRYIDCNKSFESFFGKTAKELAGMSVFDINPREFAEIYHAQDMELIQHPGVQIHESQVQDSQGTLHDVVFHKASILDSFGKVRGLIGVILDITERKQMEKQLFESEKHYHMLFDSIDEGFCIIQLIFDENEKPVDYLFLETNPSFEKQTGLIDARGKRMRELAPGNEDYWYKIYGNIALTGQPAHFENRAEQLHRWYDVYAFRFGDPKDKQVAILFNDITERKEVELALINANKELAFQISAKSKQEEENKVLEELSNSLKLDSQYTLSLIEASRDPLITISPEGKIMDLNEATVKITGEARHKLIGSKFTDYFTEKQKAHEMYLQVFVNGSVVNFPLTFLHKNGNPTEVLFNGSVYKDESGKVKGIVVEARDITEIKKSEEKFRLFLESAPDAIIIINQDGKIQLVNSQTEKLFGYKRDEIIGKKVEILIPSRSKIVHPNLRKGFIDNPSAFSMKTSSNLFGLNKHGEEFPIEINLSKISLEGDKLISASIRDVSNQKKIENELKEAKSYAEQATKTAESAKTEAESAALIAENAVKAKQQFLSNMSHEIRTPMNAIIGFTKVLLKTNFSAKQKEYLEAIKLSGDALIVLINDILDLAKVDAGKMTFEQTPFKMSASISAMLHLFKPKIQEKNLKLVTEYDKKIPQVLIGDPVRLHQIILNLVSNAVKFTHKGKITFSVRLLKEDEETVTIEFAVTDTGIGIPEAKLTSIFGNFQQATSGTSRLYGGTGLGLSIAKQLVEAQGGSITVKSKIDEGSTFSFFLSFKKTTLEALAVNEQLVLNTEINNLKILVVEDIPLNQLLMKTILEEFGFYCDIADNGKIAIEKMRVCTYDIILMDLQMPEMNGFEATDYIRNKMHSDTPIIALTADVTTVDLAKCRAVGMNDYIAKPVDERTLYRKIVEFTKEILPEKEDKQSVTKIKESIDTKCINLDYLKQLTRSNAKMMMEMITLYINQTQALISLIKKSYEEKDWFSLHAAVHKLIPSFSIVGIRSKYEEIAKTVQEYAHIQEDTDELSEMILQLESICTQACIELENEFNTLKTQTHEQQE